MLDGGVLTIALAASTSRYEDSAQKGGEAASHPSRAAACDPRALKWPAALPRDCGRAGRSYCRGGAAGAWQCRQRRAVGRFRLLHASAAAPDGYSSRAEQPARRSATPTREILETHFMVKRAMKQVPVGSPLHRTLNARQFGLKLIANVTYGYTSASFSGRMPNVHIADAIVQTGRDTLQRTIELVDNHPTWGAKVVYGDTDSLFVLVEGRSRPDAFKIGRDIARTVTEINPHPMELELEKVYHPCVL